MIPLHGEPGNFYYAVKCQNEHCREILYVLEIDNSIADTKKDSVIGQYVRCSFCTQETLIESRCILTIGVR